MLEKMQNFLGPHKNENYGDLTNMLTVPMNMDDKGLKIHPVFTFFPMDLVAKSNKYGKMFHQEIFEIDKNWFNSILNVIDYNCWFLQRE